MDPISKKPAFSRKGIMEGEKRSAMDEWTRKVKKRMELRQDTEFGW